MDAGLGCVREARDMSKSLTLKLPISAFAPRFVCFVAPHAGSSRGQSDPLSQFAACFRSCVCPEASEGQTLQCPGRAAVDLLFEPVGRRVALLSSTRQAAVQLDVPMKESDLIQPDED